MIQFNFINHHYNKYKVLILIVVRAVLFASFFFVIFVVSFFAYLAYQTQVEYKNRIYPGVFVNDSNVSGFTKQQFFSEITKQNSLLYKHTKITAQYDENEISTFSATLLSVHYDPDTTYKLAFDSGRKLTNIDDGIHIIQQLFLGNTTYITVFPRYNLKPLESYLNIIKKKYTVLPVNALFTVDGNRVIAFQEDTKGIGIDSQFVLHAVRNHLKQKPDAILKPLHVRIPTYIIQPKYSMEDANDFGIVEPIGVGVSNFSHSASPRVFNIQLVSSRVNGTLIPKGEIFSFNKTVGEISYKTGYQAGYAIISGKTVLSDGGGVCQESTTIFRAALNAGLPIEQWKNHSYRVRYYEQGSGPGFDATVYAPSVDFKFKNDTPAHILVQSKITDNYILTVTLYGKKDGRIASVSASRVWGVVPPPEPLYTDDPTLPKGTVKQVDYPAWGAKASFDYVVTRDNEELQNRTFLSVYRPWQAVFLVGTL